MTEPRIYTAEEAEALRAAATPGPWHAGHSVEGRMNDDWNIYNDDDCDVTSPTGTGICAEDAAMLAAAPDLAASVAHHARRADAAEAMIRRIRWQRDKAARWAGVDLAELDEAADDAGFCVEVSGG